MSQQSQNLKNFPDAFGKTIEDDSEAYERIDSGFISGEITSENLDSGLIEDKIPSSKHIAEDNISSSKTIEEDEDEKEREALQMILDSGVCLSEQFSNINIKEDLTDEKTSPVDLGSKKIKSDFPLFFYEPDEDGDTHLHVAISQGFPEVALALIRMAPYPSLLDTPNEDSETPLHIAVATGQWPIVRWLRVAGARPACRDINGDSPMHLAVKKNDFMCVRALAEPVKVEEREQLALSYNVTEYRAFNFDQWNYLGQTCVHVAAVHGNIEVLKHLVWYGANINAREGCMGFTALHFAVKQRNEQLVKFLLQCPKIDVLTESYGGRTALEITLLVPSTIEQLLKNKGVPSPYISEDEEEDSDDEPMIYENTHRLTNIPVVNASA